MVSDALRNLLQHLLLGTRGGPTRAKILITLKERPMNINQLANHLNMHYKTIEYHIQVLMDNGLVVPVGERYSVTYRLSDFLESHFEVFMKVWEGIREKEKRRPLE